MLEREMGIRSSTKVDSPTVVKREEGAVLSDIMIARSLYSGGHRRFGVMAV